MASTTSINAIQTSTKWTSDEEEQGNFKTQEILTINSFRFL